MPTNMQLLDNGFPDMNNEESVEGKLDRLTDYVYTLLENLRFLLSNLNSSNFNEAGLAEITAPVMKTIEDVEGNLMNVTITADSAKLTASNALGKAQAVELTVEGFTVTNPQGQTKIDGGQISSDSVIAAKLTSATANGGAVVLEDGGIRVYRNLDDFFWLGTLGEYLGTFRLANMSSGTPLKIEGVGNMSINASGTIFIATDAGGGNQIDIGAAGKTINLLGNVMVNGKPLA